MSEPTWSSCLYAATLAPSIHNTQPWLFRPHDGSVDVLADRRRQLGVLDPDGRALHLSIGAALFNLQVALHAEGRAGRLLLAPDPGHPDLCATVQIGRRVPVSPLARRLSAAIRRRHTNRRPFAPVGVPGSVLSALVGAAMVEDASLLVLDPVARGDVLTLVRFADREQRRDGRYRTELAAWTAPVAGQADGVPREAFGPRPDPARLPLRDLGLVHSGHRRIGRFEAEPTIAVLYSRADGPAGWLRAGMALQRVLLTATAHGLSTTLMTQPIEVPVLRARLAAPHEPRVAQAVLRLGYAHPVAGTPRRTVSSLLVGEGAWPEADPRRAQTSRAETGRAQTSRAETGRAETSQAGTSPRRAAAAGTWAGAGIGTLTSTDPGAGAIRRVDVRDVGPGQDGRCGPSAAAPQTRE